MNVLLQTLWTVWSEDQRTQAIELARMGERLCMALGSPAFARSADALTANSSAGDVDAWAEQYTAQTDAGRGMPLTVLWSGLSTLDILRADRVIQYLQGTAAAAPAWPQVLDRLRTAPQPVRSIADWFFSRSATVRDDSWLAGLFTNADELQLLHERLTRAWWWQLAQRMPELPAPGALGTQSVTVGTGTVIGPTVPTTGLSTPIQPPAQSQGIGWGEIALAVLAYMLLSR